MALQYTDDLGPITDESPFDQAIVLEGTKGQLLNLARSIYGQESNSGKNTKTSNAGAVGGMQITPDAFNEVADKGWDINNPLDNARAGIRYLAKMYKDGGNDARLAAIGYYGGPGAIAKAREGKSVSDPRNPKAPNTFEYADSVLDRLKKFGGEIADAIIPPAQASEVYSPSMGAVTPAGAVPYTDDMGAIVPSSTRVAPTLSHDVTYGSGPDAVTLHYPGGIDVSKTGSGKSQDKEATAQPQKDVTPSTFFGRVETGLMDPVHGGAQLLTHVLPQSVVQAGNEFNNYLVDKGFPLARIPAGGVDQMERQREARYQAQRAAAGSTGVDWARMLGNVASPANVAAAAAMPELELPVLARGAGTGMTLASLDPVTGRDFWSDKGKQVALGGVAGGTGNALVRGAARVVQPQTDAVVKNLLAQGVHLTPGQVLGGIPRRIEDASTSIPILGDFIKGAQRRGIEDFNRAAYRRVMAPLGKEAPEKAGRQSIESIHDALTDAYEKLLPKTHLRLDKTFSNDLDKLTDMARSLPEVQEKAFQKIVDSQIRGKVTAGNVMDGKTLKSVESELSRRARGLRHDQSFDNQELGRAIEELNASIRRNLIRQNPDQAGELRKINEAFANFVRVRDAASRTGAKEGVFTPAQLQAAVRAADSSAGKGRFAEGKALLQDLSEAGKSRMSSEVPDSGTPLRSMVGVGALAGSAALAPKALGVLAAALPYTKYGLSLADLALTARPQAANALANLVRRSAKYATPAFIPRVGGVNQP